MNKYRGIMLRLLIPVVLFAAVMEARSAESVKVSFIKDARQMHAETKNSPGDAPSRELARYFYVDQIKSSKGLAFVLERGANTDDQIDGTGSHTGVSALITASGDEVYQSFAGTHKTTTKADGTWEATYQGLSTVRGGTGKYKNAQGVLRYKGRITADSFHEEDEGEIRF